MDIELHSANAAEHASAVTLVRDAVADAIAENGQAFLQQSTELVNTFLPTGDDLKLQLQAAQPALEEAIETFVRIADNGIHGDDHDTVSPSGVTATNESYPTEYVAHPASVAQELHNGSVVDSVVEHVEKSSSRRGSKAAAQSGSRRESAAKTDSLQGVSSEQPRLDQDSTQATASQNAGQQDLPTNGLTGPGSRKSSIISRETNGDLPGSRRGSKAASTGNDQPNSQVNKSVTSETETFVHKAATEDPGANQEIHSGSRRGSRVTFAEPPVEVLPTTTVKESSDSKAENKTGDEVLPATPGEFGTMAFTLPASGSLNAETEEFDFPPPPPIPTEDFVTNVGGTDTIVRAADDLPAASAVDHLTETFIRDGQTQPAVENDHHVLSSPTPDQFSSLPVGANLISSVVKNHHKTNVREDMDEKHCSVCAESVDKEAHLALRGKHFHKKCYENAHTGECSGCSGKIRLSEAFVTVADLGRDWHLHCLKCGTCDSHINGAFLLHNDLPVCEICYLEKFAPDCASCAQPILGKSVKAMSVFWHPDCFICVECRAALSKNGNEYFNVEGRPYCKTDVEKGHFRITHN